MEKIGNKAREILRTVPPAERKPPTSGAAETRSNKAGESGSEMEVEESETQARRPDIKPPPPAKVASGSQATKAVRRVFSPPPGSHLEEAVHRRFPTPEVQQENRILEDRRRKAELRDQKVNRMQGSALVETAQQVRQEQEATKPKLTCTEEMQVDTSPFFEAPTSNVAPGVEDSGAPTSMEF